MQEEVENRTVNLAISTTKLTGRTIIAGIRKYLQHREKVKMKKARDPAVHGKQSVKQLLGQNQGATLDAICKEHQARALTKNEKPSVLAQLKKFKEIVAAIPKKVREKKQERDL